MNAAEREVSEYEHPGNYKEPPKHPGFYGPEIPGEMIEALIEAVRWAPSAGNLQSRKFYFVLNRRQRWNSPGLRSISILLPWPACGRRLPGTAGLPHATATGGVNLYSIQDVAASVENMLLTAHELGLGSVWVGAFNEYDVAGILELPDNLRPVAIVPIGYPARTPRPPAEGFEG